MKELQEVLAWMKGTDLAELSYRKAGEGIQLRSGDAPSPSLPAFPPCSLTAVTSPEVGLFRWGAAGQARRLEKGARVEKDQPLFRVQVGKREAEVHAPVAGSLLSVLVDDGDAVEYGQPVLFIRPE
ncbi:MAG TPA: biotin/lipoyl-containing protein [Elusimicrobiota bacterium]|jgi:acetyl-CoA carboxylase biotin carboxyl carrier protein|nr:biotin/lipoyl-containing protein [Elusimicrobiota bacterium]